jgi:prepilin-type N-terminal cleavage/methylation domain-containing protein
MRRRDAGFSLIEMMIVLILVLIIAGVILQVITLTMQRSATEQTKLDMFQEAREFMDQMSRDLRQAGYPSPRNMDPSVFTQSTLINDLKASAGVVKVSAGELIFEGDVDNSGTVSSVRYTLDTSTTGGCPCLKRSVVAKANGDPLTQTTSYEVEVQGVQNTNIFSAYTNGTAVALPVDYNSSGGTTLAAVDTVEAILTLQASAVDPQTRKKPVTTLVMTARLNNCSQAAIGFKTSCQ